MRTDHTYYVRIFEFMGTLKYRQESAGTTCEVLESANRLSKDSLSVYCTIKKTSLIKHSRNFL
jgi:hypothetical protein